MIICRRQCRTIERCVCTFFALIFLPKLIHAAAQFACNSWTSCYEELANYTDTSSHFTIAKCATPT